MKKALVFGVIILFIGVGFQPTLANETSTNIVSDVDEDCLECQPVSRVDLLKVKLLLIRAEVLINRILSKLGHIPEIREKCKEALDIIHSNVVLDYPIICSFLDNLGNSLGNLWDSIITILENHPNNLILQIIISPIGMTLLFLIFSVIGIGYMFDCWE